MKSRYHQNRVDPDNIYDFDGIFEPGGTLTKFVLWYIRTMITLSWQLICAVIALLTSIIRYFNPKAPKVLDISLLPQQQHSAVEYEQRDSLPLS